MKTSLRIGITLLLAMVVQGYGFAQSVATTLGGLTNVRTGITEEFTVTTQGGSEQMVRGKFDFTPYQEGDIVLQYKAPGAQEYTTLATDPTGIIMFGPETGFTFPATATTHDFKIFINRADTYNYTLDLVTVEATPQTVATTNGAVTVTTPTQFPTIDGTLDVVAQQKGLVVNQADEWQILVNANEFAGVKGNIQVVLANPAQSANITLLYDAKRATTTGGDPDFQPLTFNEQGIATIGPAEGEVLTADGINQLMKASFTQAGTYSYTLRFRRDEGTTLASVQETVTVSIVAGIDDMIGNSRITVYPTITNGSVRIDLGDVRNASIAVTDMLGRTVLRVDSAAGSVQLNTAELAKGTYFIKVIKGNDVAGSRFIVR
ncbi:T9SS type A sorting domain-containing protein [Pontibacter sp. MBLB2868]|uniref:T9SS type A sorting domain-containing protein n=1 Tax=Pontibacter sp. MBLB2868 TaxID=3451555 RepID=UPI003F754C86